MTGTFTIMFQAKCEASRFSDVSPDETGSAEIAIEMQVALILIQLFGGRVMVEKVRVDYKSVEVDREMK